MVVADFHVMGVLSLPAKADAPLVVDTDRVLSNSVSSERLQTITGWHSKIVQRARSIQLHELPQGNTYDLGRKSVGAFASPKALRPAARETCDHDVIVSQGDTPSIFPRNRPPERLRIRAGDERLVVGLQLVDGVSELLSDVDGVAVQGEPVAGSGVAGEVLGPLLSVERVPEAADGCSVHRTRVPE